MKFGVYYKKSRGNGIKADLQRAAELRSRRRLRSVDLLLSRDPAPAVVMCLPRDRVCFGATVDLRVEEPDGTLRVFRHHFPPVRVCVRAPGSDTKTGRQFSGGLFLDAIFYFNPTLRFFRLLGAEALRWEAAGERFPPRPTSRSWPPRFYTTIHFFPPLTMFSFLFALCATGMVRWHQHALTAL